MDSKALTVIKQIQTELEKITLANGYGSDAGLRVSRGRLRISPDESFPLLLIHEGDETVDKRAGNNTVQLSEAVTIEGFAQSDPDNPLDAAHYLLADIKRALFPAIQRHPGLIIRGEYDGKSIQTPDDGSGFVSVQVRIKILWSEYLSDPDKI
jgi:predicted TIM-barrel enzyme